MYLIEVDGRSLYQTIREYLQRMQNGKKLAMGKLYHAKLMDKFQGRDSVWAKKTVADETQLEDRQLLVVIMALHAAKKSVGELILWVEFRSAIYQKNFVALIRTLLKVLLSRSMPNASLTIAAMGMITRPAGLDEALPVDVQAFVWRRRHYSEPCASLASTATLFGGEAARANVQAVFAMSTDALLEHDLQFPFRFAFQLKTKDRQKHQDVKCELWATVNLKEGARGLEAVQIELSRTSAGYTRSLVKALFA
jgi:hypothetical protein